MTWGLAILSGLIVLWAVFYVAVPLRMRRWAVIAVALVLPLYSLVSVFRWADGAEQSPDLLSSTTTSATVATTTVVTVPPGSGHAECDGLVPLHATDPTIAREQLDRLRLDAGAPVDERLCASAVVAELERAAKVEPPTNPMLGPSPTCDAFAAIAAVDTARVRAALDSVLDDPDATVAERGCALAQLAAMERDDGDRIAYAVVREMAAEVGDRLIERPIGIADEHAVEVLVSLLLIDLLLLLVAWRQLRLWRAERKPGPVLVEAVEVVGETTAVRGEQLAHVMRERLIRTGTFPPVGVGEDEAVLLEAVEVAGKAGEGNWFVRAISMAGRAIKPPIGYRVESTARLDAEGVWTLTYTVLRARTDETLHMEVVRNAVLEGAVRTAAFEVYVFVTGTPEVRRRTPIWLAWTSAGALERYHNALALSRQRDQLGALDALEAAARLQPANMLIPLLAGRSQREVAQGIPDDIALATTARPERYFFDAAVSHVRAVLLAPDSQLTRSQLAVTLAYANDWAGKFGDPRERAVLVLLTDLLNELACVRPDGSRTFGDGPPRGRSSNGEQPLTADQLARRAADALIDVSIEQWLVAERLLRPRRQWRMWYRLETRREVVGLYGSLLRRVVVRRRVLQAGRLATECVARSRPRAVLVRRARRIEADRRRWQAEEMAAFVFYNLASAYANLPPEEFADGSRPDPETVAARRLLNDASLAAGRRFSDADREELLADSYFASLAVSLESLKLVYPGEDSTARARRVWERELAHGARLGLEMQELWARRRARWLRSSDRPDRSEVVEWFAQDLALWSAVARWSAAPSVRGLRRELDSLIARIERDQDLSAAQALAESLTVHPGTQLGEVKVAFTALADAAEAQARLGQVDIGHARRRADMIATSLGAPGLLFDRRAAGQLGEAHDAWRQFVDLVRVTLTTPAEARLERARASGAVKEEADRQRPQNE
jgi:hypothetical protein